mmetsp:Transcript_87092/g.281986  ORF Transcript_87092/g.281986 Transcript_87092/m.281986 type:complete len:206 (+) Transcript_87092:163-780(+)
MDARDFCICSPTSWSRPVAARCSPTKLRSCSFSRNRLSAVPPRPGSMEILDLSVSSRATEYSDLNACSRLSASAWRLAFSALASSMSLSNRRRVSSPALVRALSWSERCVMERCTCCSSSPLPLSSRSSASRAARWFAFASFAEAAPSCTSCSVCDSFAWARVSSTSSSSIRERSLSERWRRLASSASAPRWISEMLSSSAEICC